ncbi:MAG: FAD-dependent oxidoreductase [Pseudomonadota bacterium]
MTFSLDTDVIVVGGGLAGAAAALGAAAAGLDVVVLDAGPKPKAPDAFDGRAYSIPLGSQRFWAQMGAWDDVADHAQIMQDVLVTDGRVSEGASSLFLHFDHREAEGGVFGWMVEDRHLRPAALNAMTASDRIEQRFDARVVGMTTEPGRAVVALASGSSISASLVVACDGANSPMRAAAGIRSVGWDYPQNGLVCAVAHEKPHHGVAHELFLPAGPFAILPLKGDRSSLVWTERRDVAERIQSLSDDGYLAEVQERFGDFLGPLTLEGGRWTYPLKLTVAHDYAAPRLALTGDAAHAIHPIAGQGLNLGVRDAAALAEVLAEALRRGEDIGDIVVLKRYQQWRRFDSTALAFACDGLNRLFSNDVGPIRAIRDIGIAAVNQMPGAKRWFMKAASGLAGETPRLMRGEAL